MNKKACRAAAATYPPLDTRCGLLHAEQVDYIIRTAVKLIDRHRTLVLYIYDRKQVAAGNCAPVWTMFHGKDGYITLSRQPDGTTKWRMAAFERLGNTWGFESKCAFYSTKDEARVARFFHSDATGFTPLICAQREILNKRLTERRQRRENTIRARMEHLPALPRGFSSWLYREVVPAYFIYSHAVKGSATGTCTSCGREITLTGIKHNAKTTCPRCGRELTAKSRGRMGRISDRSTAQVLQRTRTGELVVRIIKVLSTIEGDAPQVSIWENARQFLKQCAEDKTVVDVYYETADGHWKKGERPTFYYGYNYYADTCGHVYCENLNDALRGTPWQYCPIGAFYEHFREPMELLPFLRAYLEHPRLEHLVKVGFYSLAGDLAYRGYICSGLDETQNRTHRILGVMAEDIPFLRELDVDTATLKVFKTYCGSNLKDRHALLSWQLEHDVIRDVLPVLEHMTVHKFLRYMDGQYSFLKLRKNKNGTQRYSKMQDLVTEYRDYLDMCGKQKYDLSNSFILYPKDLQKSHDSLARRIKQKADAKTRRAFKAAYRKVMDNLDYESNGMKILYPASPEEISEEGNALHHCVGGYVDRVAKQECLILFLRQCVDVGKPFYTVEVRDGKVVQVRGMLNSDATPEVQTFISQWESNVLQGHSFENAA